MFSYEICKLFKNIVFYRTSPVAASKNDEHQQLSEGFANSCYKIVSPLLLQELINDFAVCKHCSGTLSLVEDVTSCHCFGNYDNLFQKEATLVNRGHTTYLC